METITKIQHIKTACIWCPSFTNRTNSFPKKSPPGNFFRIFCPPIPGSLKIIDISGASIPRETTDSDDPNMVRDIYNAIFPLYKPIYLNILLNFFN